MKNGIGNHSPTIFMKLKNDKKNNNWGGEVFMLNLRIGIDKRTKGVSIRR